jgi:UDP:flavonoid glycosyltransferase YjiC (YdhE family)
MVRILIATLPAEGHVRPGIPIAKALVDRGHDVTWYTGSKFKSMVAGTGARFAPVGAILGIGDGDVLRDRDAKPGISGMKKVITEAFVVPIPKYVADVTEVAEKFGPDVMIADHCFMASPIVAGKLGIPNLIFSVGPLILSSIDTAPFGTGLPPSSTPVGRLRNKTMMWLAKSVLFRGPQRLSENIWRDLGNEPPPGFILDWGVHIADRYLQASIPEFEYPRSDLPDTVEFVGPMLPPAPSDWSVPAWWPEIAEAREAGRPVVLVTQGTSNTDLSQLVLPAIEALAGQDMLVIATTAGPDPEELMPAARRPANLRLVRFIPFAELLPLTDLMVTNGGFGGVQTALASGVPLVVTGSEDARAEVGALAVWAGAGLSLRVEYPSAAELRKAVATVLSEGAYRASAQRLKAAYARYSGPSRAAEVVLEVARERPRADLVGESLVNSQDLHD